MNIHIGVFGNARLILYFFILLDEEVCVGTL